VSTPKTDLLRRAVRLEDAIAFQQRGDLAHADAICAELLRAQPGHVDAWHLRGLLALQAGQFERGVEFVQRSLALSPNQPAAHANVATALLQLDKVAEALIHFERSLTLQPGNATTLYGRGSALLKLQRFEPALIDFDRVLTLLPTLVPALCARGQVLHQLGRADEALSCLDRALELAPQDAATHFHRANVLFDLKRYEDALASYECARNAGWSSVDLFNNRGNALRQLFRLSEALASYEQALAVAPGLPEALTNRGNVLLDLNKPTEAVACYDAALRAQPDFVAALENRGLALSMADQPEEAARSYARLLEVAPHYEQGLTNHLNVLCNLLHTRCLSADWGHYDVDRAVILKKAAEGKPLHPFPFLAISGSPSLQLQAARGFASQWQVPERPLWNGERYRHERLRVAYLSADFRDHVVSYLMAGLFERHDRDAFETIGVSLPAFDSSVTGKRVKAAFEHFVEVHADSDRKVAERLRELEVDVIVDLMGFTRGSRPGILAHRAAPVQVNYLGYPGTMGAPFIDYIVADEFVIPPDSRQYYSEQVVYLPECFQANDDRCTVDPKPTRAEVGLPPEGVVLCCINNNYKLNPPLFEIWMRLLREAPGSVLWLLADRDSTQANLRREAAARGVNPGRLVFAGRMPYAQHLGRLGLADLFLDTLPYNAGATASDALRVGVPVLTCAGEAFASRMAGSLLKAVRLPELITHTLEEYERKALELIREPQVLGALRARLMESLAHAPLFDTARFCRHLESAYRTMHERAMQGERP
jgi:protein O-GlcNAc transferase